MLETERTLKIQNELLLREKETFLQQSQRDREELSKKMEHEKELLNVTLEAMSRELSKMREEKNFLSDTFSKERKELERKHEAEMTELRKRLERNKQELMTRLREEHKQAAQAIQRSTDTTIAALKEKLIKAERKINEMEEHFKKEKNKMEHQFEHDKMELEQRTQKISQELKVILEQDYYRRTQDERKVHENAMSSLRREISDLRESKIRLENALSEQQMIAYNLGRDINLLKSEVQVSIPRKTEQSLLERELQELRHRNEKLKLATKEAQFFNSELFKWDKGKNCPVLRTAQELKSMDSIGKPSLKDGRLTYISDGQKPLLVVAEDQIVHEGNPTVQIDEPIYMASQSSNTGEQQHSVPSLFYSNEDAPVRFVEQRTIAFQSSNDRLEKELEKMGQKLDSLENRKNDLMQEADNEAVTGITSNQSTSTVRVYSGSTSSYQQTRLDSPRPSTPNQFYQ